MKRIFPAHIAGAAFAALTFVLGSHFATNTAPTGPAGEAPSPSLTILSPELNRSGTTGAREVTPGPEMQLVDRGSGFSLNSETINRLGKIFRTSLDPVERSLAFAKLLKGLTAENALEIRKQIAHLEPGSREFQDFHYAWGKLAGAEAVLFGANTKDPVMASAVAGWASADPRAALDWFNGLNIADDPRFDALLTGRNISHDDLRNDLLKGLLQGVANADINLAASVAYDLAAAGDAQAKEIMQMITNKMIESRGLQETMDWASRLPEGQMQGAATERVVQSWGRTDANAALTWAKGLGLEYGGGPALSAAYGFWGAGASGTDPLIASQTINDMPDSLVRDFAINGFISGLRWSDPEGAVIWAQTITQPNIREAAVVRAAGHYFEVDPAGATQWLATSDLPGSTRQKLTHGFPK